MLKFLIIILLEVLTNLNGKLSYSGHAVYWSDDGKNKKYSVHAVWNEVSDSSDAEFLVTDSTNHTDTMLFHKLPNKNWSDAFLFNNRDRHTSGRVRILQTSDSLKIFLGFGFTGNMYYLKRDL